MSESPRARALAGERLSPAAQLLHWSLRGVDPEAGTAEVGFELGEQFRNPVGQVHGGFLAAMLDDVCGLALLATLNDDEFPPTVSLTVQFLAPAQPGAFVGHGRVSRRGKRIGFVSGELYDSEGTLIATAQSTLTIQRRREA